MSVISRIKQYVESGNWTASGTHTFSGAATFNDLIEADFDPSARVYARAEVAGRIYTKAVASDWSLFKSAASGNMDFVCSGSGGFGTSALSDGGCALSHASTSSSFVFIKPRTGSRFDTIKWNTSDQPRFRAVIKTGTVTSQKIQVGLQSGGSQPRRFIGPGGSGHSNAAYFFLDQPTNASWKVDVAGGATSSTSGDCATAAASDTVYDLELRVSSSRIVTAYINSTLVYTSTQTLAAGKALTPVIGLQTEDNDHNGFRLYHVMMSRTI